MHIGRSRSSFRAAGLAKGRDGGNRNSLAVLPTLSWLPNIIYYLFKLKLDYSIFKYTCFF